MSLPTDAKARKAVPIYSGVIKYFPDAIAAVAELSRIGNDQHNPGKDLFWDRSKSQDEHDALMRHLMEAGTIDTDGVRHSAKVAWRALAALQKEIEREREAGSPLVKPILGPGWIPWGGGDQPVPDGVRVRARLEDGTESTLCAQDWYWHRVPLSGGGNIVAYKVES